MLNFFKFFTSKKYKKLINDGNYSSANFNYKTNDGRKFSVSERGWHLINQTHSISENTTLSSLSTDKLLLLSKFAKFLPQYNYLVDPTTIEGTQGDHVLVTVFKREETIIDEENLERTKLKLMEEWSRTRGYIKKMELELVDRHKMPNLPKSAYAKLHIKDIVEEYFSIQTPQKDIVVSFSASSKNIKHYQRIMFDIVDSIELKI